MVSWLFLIGLWIFSLVLGLVFLGPWSYGQK